MDIEKSFIFVKQLITLHNPAPMDDVHKSHDNADSQKHMNKPSHRIAAYHSQSPKY